MSRSAEPPSKCPLCAHDQFQVAELLLGKDLRRLWRAGGHELSPQAWGKIVEDYPVAMWRCQRCGFLFFDSSLAGNEAFYREIEHPEYYSLSRPEFDRTLRFISG